MKQFPHWICKGQNVKESTVEDKDLQAGASAGDAQQTNSEENKDEAPEAVPMKLTKRNDLHHIWTTRNGLYFRAYQD